MPLFRIACALAVSGALLGCGPEHRAGTEVPDPEDALYGMVKGQDGHPVIGARVIAWAQPDAAEKAKSDSTLLSKDTVITDSTGYYGFKDTLASGHYNLYFEEDTVSGNEKRTLGRGKVLYDVKGRVEIEGNLSSPVILVLTVTDTSARPMEGATCTIQDSPYEAKTDSKGMAALFVPEGEYTLYCSHGYSWRYLPFNVAPGSVLELAVELYPEGKLLALPPPDSLSIAYNENSGIASLSWPPVTDSRLFNYGVGRVNIDSGGGLMEFPTYFPYWTDPVFDPKDSVQLKNLQYSVSSLRRDPTANGGGRRRYSRLTALRPWAYGARIDSLIAVPRDSGFRAGDTVRFAGFWTNRIGVNDTLYWWIQGDAERKAVRANPPAKGSDTLAVVLPASGEYKINMSIHDAEGYRSWLSIPFRF